MFQGSLLHIRCINYDFCVPGDKKPNLTELSKKGECTWLAQLVQGLPSFISFAFSVDYFGKGSPPGHWLATRLSWDCS